MKKTSFVLFSGIAAMALAGCQSSEESSENIETVLQNSHDTMSETTSYQMDTTAGSAQNDQGLETTMKLVREPFAYSSVQSMSNPETDETQETMMFIQDGQYYEQDPMLEEWITVPTEEAGMDDPAAIQPAENQLEALANHADLLSMEETEEHYQITASGTSEEATELVLTFMNQSPEELDIELNDFSYEMLIDKDSLLQESSQLSIDGELVEQGQPFSEEVAYEFSQFDALEEADVDESAMDEAISLEEAQEQMADMQAEMEQEMEQQQE
ncbi:DUF6612 family protein [Shouchella sp. 1P09AA]|uniref:DUF6612 family protein n=1 Tax=unclassified Shouchella TaxID=2893065 RepID=UPI0039A10966